MRIYVHCYHYIEQSYSDSQYMHVWMYRIRIHRCLELASYDLSLIYLHIIICWHVFCVGFLSYSMLPKHWTILSCSICCCSFYIPSPHHVALYYKYTPSKVPTLSSVYLFPASFLFGCYLSNTLTNKSLTSLVFSPYCLKGQKSGLMHNIQ